MEDVGSPKPTCWVPYTWTGSSLSQNVVPMGFVLQEQRPPLKHCILPSPQLQAPFLGGKSCVQGGFIPMVVAAGTRAVSPQ